MGESATEGTVFTSYQFTGVRLYSDETMLPNSQRGFAPTIRGIANSSAIVTVRQNGYTLYQSNVPPALLKSTTSTPLPSAAI